MPNSVDPLNKGRPIGVVVIDPVPLFRDGLGALLARSTGVRLLGMTGNLHAAIVLCERIRPDVVLVDAMLDPRCHLGSLLQNSDDTLAVLSVMREPLRTARYLNAAITAGVQGVILRTADPSAFVDAIKRTFTERRYLDPDLGVLANGLGIRATVSARQPLSRREYQVLQLISDGLENSAIAKALFVSIETIRTHVKNILRKLHARDRAHAVAVAFRLGLLVAHRDSPFPTLSGADGQPQLAQPQLGQPAVGQPHPGQPHPGQPHPGQPHPGQPHPGQTHPGQPHLGQSPAGQQVVPRRTTGPPPY